ncbi:MAG TPA: permease-like cell division protein FtsX [Clostridia bacterium]|nr:permease-like cell division protein FtsX [Clostridia bacterium]
MKIRTVRHIIKEGAINSYRNKLMSLASVMIVTATLVVFGFFLLTAYNLEDNIKVWKESPQLEAFCYDELDDAQVQKVEDSIKNNDKIVSYEKVTKEEAFQKAKEKLGSGTELLNGYGESIFPVSFIIKLKDTAYSKEVVATLEKTSGIRKVSYSQDTIDIITRISYWIKLGSSFMVTVFLIVSIFIISNTIKLTVFARRKEINIMKYIGATDWFIRWPFVVEGVIISVIGAVVAFVISTYAYNAIQVRFAQDLFIANTQLLKLAKVQEVWSQLAVYYMLIGAVVGTMGSFLSIRRYLKV